LPKTAMPTRESVPRRSAVKSEWAPAVPWQELEWMEGS